MLSKKYNLTLNIDCIDFTKEQEYLIRKEFEEWVHEIGFGFKSFEEILQDYGYSDAQIRCITVDLKEVGKR